MAKKKKKTAQKKKPIKKVSAKPSVKNSASSQKAIKKSKTTQKKESQKSIQKIATPKKDIAVNSLLKEKIKLDESSFSYTKAFKNKYGRIKASVGRPWRRAFKALLILMGIFGVAFVSLFIVFGRDLPDVSKLKSMDFAETTTIYDREGHVLYSVFSEENRKYVPLDNISPYILDATVSIEDKNFYHHWGFDPVGIVRAQLKNISEDDIVQGASTITQQLAKNIFLSPERTYERKIKELLLAMEIEWTFSKDDILELYLNKIPYGSNSFGVEAAAKTFFGKEAKDLDLAESSIIASLPKAPTFFSPYGQNKLELMGYCNAEETVIEKTPPVDGDNSEGEIIADPGDVEVEEVLEPIVIEAPGCSSWDDPNYVWGRKDFVLQRMIEDKHITVAEANSAWKESLTLEFLDPVHKIEAAHFVFYVKEILEKKYGKELVENGGLEVVTSLDPKLQSLGEEVISKTAEYNLSKYRANNAALVAIDPKTGQVLAMVGSKNYWDADINGQVNVTTSPRQPGSSFKPLVYAAAVENGKIGSGSVLSDNKTVFNTNYIPSNSDDKYKGSMIVRYALAQSRNIPAIKAFYVAGEEEKLLDFMDKIGVTNLRAFKDDFNATSEERGWTFNYGPAMAIGSGEVPLIEMVSGYSVLANGGYRNPVNPILEVRDRHGNVLEKNEDVGYQAIDAQAAFIIDDILSDVYARPGGSWRATLTVPDHTVAAKTGTSNKKVGKTDYPNNLLTIGYTPSIALGVWVGNTDGSYLYRTAWGLTGAAPIWKEFMLNALAEKPDEPFVEPEGIVHKGHEVYPSYYEARNLDAMFKKVEKEEEEVVKYTPETLPETDFVGEKFDTPRVDETPIEEEKLVIEKEPITAPLLPPPVTPDIPYGF